MLSVANGQGPRNYLSSCCCWIFSFDLCFINFYHLVTPSFFPPSPPSPSPSLSHTHLPLPPSLTPIYLTPYLSLYQSPYLSLYLSISISIYPSINISVSTYPSITISICQSINQYSITADPGARISPVVGNTLFDPFTVCSFIFIFSF